MITETHVFDNALSNRIVYKDGYLRVNNNILTSATVSPYYGREIPNYESLGFKENEIYYGLRDKEELAKAKDTFEGLPLLLNHTVTSSENIPPSRIGAVGNNLDMRDNDLIGPIFVHDQHAIDLVNDKSFRGISCSYSFNPVADQGTYDGKSYDFRMTDIVGNHVALVEKPRVQRAVVADNNTIKKGNKMNLNNIFKVLGGRKYAQDADIDPKDFRKALADIENSDATEEEKDNQFKALMERFHNAKLDDKVAPDRFIEKGNRFDSGSKVGDAQSEEDKEDKKDEEHHIVDNEELKRLIREEVRSHLAELHDAAKEEEDREDKEEKKAMDSALKTYRSLYGEPNIAAFSNKASNVYKTILNSNGIANDSMSLIELKTAAEVLAMTRKSYQASLANDSISSSSILNDPIVQKAFSGVR